MDHLELRHIDPEALSESDQEAVIELALSVLSARVKAAGGLRIPIESPDDYVRMIRLRIGAEKNEVFGISYMDTRHRIIKNEILFNGTIDGTAVYTCVVVQKALEYNAAAVMLYHNHPSGVVEPSEADRGLTLKLGRALALVGIQLVDHIVVTGDEHVSLAERGWI